MPTNALQFNIFVKRPDDSGVPGAVLRILNENDDDVTAAVFGASAPVTDASGYYSKIISAPPANKAYKVQVIAAGYELWNWETNSDFLGYSTFTAGLTPSTVAAPGDYVLTEPEALYASSLYPITASIESTNTASWELIRYHITNLSGKSVVQEIPVDPTTQLATADLHSRARLHPVPYLVPDGEAALVDPVFSDELAVTTESLTEITTLDLNLPFTISVANMVPDGESNNLENYATGRNGGDGLQKWITLFSEPIIFRNYYIDTMLWLTGEGVAYALKARFFDGAGNQVGSTINNTIQGNKQVQRIRMESSPSATVKRAQLWVEQGGVVITDILTVHYRG